MAGGQQLTSSQGNVTASGGTIVLSGIASVVGQGDLFGSERGQQFTAQQGSVTGSLTKIPDGVGDPYTGKTIFSGQGTLVAQAGSLTLTGSGSTLSAGTVYPSGNNVTVNITGIDLDFFTGFIVNGGQPLTGIAITGSLGAYVISNTMPISGIGTTFGQGAIGVGQDADDVYITSSHGNSLANADVPLVGSAVAVSQGTLTITGDITQSLTGEAITSAQQTIEHTEEYALTGEAITGSQSPFGAPGVAALTGSQIAVQQNDLYTNDDRTYALTGQGMVISDGLAVTSYLAFATGQELIVGQQGIGPREVTLVGELINAYQETLYIDRPLRDAGRGKGKGKGKDRDRDRGRFLVQIDDEEFEVESQEQAEALIEAARAGAKETAAAQAKQAIEQRAKEASEARKPMDVTPIELQVPLVMSSDETFKKQLEDTLAAVYKRAEIDAEIAMNLQKQRLLDEEDNLVLLLID